MDQAAVRALRLTEELCAKLCFVGHERCDLNEVEGSFWRASGVIIYQESIETEWKSNPPFHPQPLKAAPLFEAYFGLFFRSLLHHGRSFPRQIQQLPACGFASACFYRADAVAFRALSWEGTLEPHSGLARPDEFMGWDVYELVHHFGYESTGEITWSFQGPGSCLRQCRIVFSVTLVQQKRTWNLWMLEWLGQDPVWAPNGFDKLHPQLTRGGQLELLQARGMVGWDEALAKAFGNFVSIWLVVGIMFRCCSWRVWRLLLQIQVITSLQVLLRLCEHFVSASCGLHASGLSFQQGPESKCTDISKIRGYRYDVHRQTHTGTLSQVEWYRLKQMCQVFYGNQWVFEYIAVRCVDPMIDLISIGIPIIVPHYLCRSFQLKYSSSLQAASMAWRSLFLVPLPPSQIACCASERCCQAGAAAYSEGRKMGMGMTWLFHILSVCWTAFFLVGGLGSFTRTTPF